MGLVGASVLFLALGTQPLAAQSGKGAGNTNSGANSGGGSRSAVTQPALDTRNIVLSGKVVTADGSPPPEPVAIEQLCNTDVVALGYTDAQGFFSLQLMHFAPVMQGASESGRDPYSGHGVLTPGASGFNQQSPGAQNPQWALMGCELRGSLVGFQSTSVIIRTLSPIGATNVGTIVLLRGEKQAATVSATSLRAPKDARKAYEKATAHIHKGKLTEAKKELERAVKLYPQYAAAWTDLGWVLEQENQLTEARAAFGEARNADDNFVPAYLGLASIALRQSNWGEAQTLSGRATQLDGVNFPVGSYYLAMANVQLGHLDQAEKSARMAEQLDVRHSIPQVNLLLGTILVRKQDYAHAAEELEAYLKFAPSAENGEEVRQRIAELKRLALPSGISHPGAKGLTAASEAQSANLEDRAKIASLVPNPNLPLPAGSQDWAPPDIDQSVPPTSPGVPCPVREVIDGVSSRAKELLDNLREFSATERIEHVKIDKEGKPGRSQSAAFKYVAEIHESQTGFGVREYRDGNSSKQSFPAHLATTGTAALALMFHPNLVEDLTITCEGLSSVRGQPAWQLHFAQRPDRPPRFRRYLTSSGDFPVQLKGRAWVATDTYQILRMETDLVKPIEAIALRKDHIIIDYRPVKFGKRHTQLWLPETADLYLDFLGRRLHRQHSFSDFELFAVDVAEKTKGPEIQ